MTRAELRAACPSNDTGGYIEWLEDRVLAAEARVAELEVDTRRAMDGHAEANKVCRETLDLNDTLLGENATLQARIAALTADEKPRQAAERIANMLHAEGKMRDYLLDAITTAIQAASDAQLERGRAKIAEMEALVFDAHFRAFPYYVWTDARSAIDLLVAEVTTLRAEYKRIDHATAVREFMEKFGQYIGETPGFPPQEVLESKLQRVTEEFCELIAACGYKSEAERAAIEMQALRLENEALRTRLESAIMFRINTAPAYINNVMRCEGHRLPKQPYMWKVLSGSGAVLGKDGEWAHEPIPSSRDDEFYAMYRFDTFEEAEAAARKDLEVAG